MSENYFENMRIMGANLDEGINKLQETWKMPQLLLCKNNEEDQIAAKKLVENLRNELTLLKGTIEENKTTISSVREMHTQFLEEITQAIDRLKEEIHDIKVLFAENDYVEDPMDPDLSILNSQLEALSVNNSNSFLKDSNNIQDSSSYNNTSLYNSSIPMQDCIDEGTPEIHNTFPSTMQKKSLLNERPMEPVYSPHFYKMMKK